MQLANALEQDFGAFLGLVMPLVLNSVDTVDGIEELVYGNRNGLTYE
jgi:hypothetical protein